jgi:ribosome modulation factor
MIEPAEECPSNAEAQLVLLRAMCLAAIQGWQEGRKAGSYVVGCPYSHRLPSLRQAWLDGFSDGRIALFSDRRGEHC